MDAFSLRVMISLFMMTSVSLSKADLINDVCSKTTYDHEYCLRALRSDPRSQVADLTTLAQIAIDIGTSKTKSTITLLQTLEAQATDLDIKECYRECIDVYEDSIDTFGECTEFLNNKDYLAVNYRAGGIGSLLDDCEGYSFEEPPVYEYEQLRKAYDQIQELSDAIIIISNELLQGKI